VRSAGLAEPLYLLEDPADIGSGGVIRCELEERLVCADRRSDVVRRPRGRRQLELNARVLRLDRGDPAVLLDACADAVWISDAAAEIWVSYLVLTAFVMGSGWIGLPPIWNIVSRIAPGAR
jgi:hypothetical protein